MRGGQGRSHTSARRGMKGDSPQLQQHECPTPAHLLSPRESVVEAGHVSHDGLLIRPQSAHNICAKRERERERQRARKKQVGNQAHAGG